MGYYPMSLITSQKVRKSDRQTVRQQGKKEKRGQEIYIFHLGFVVHFLESYDKQLHKDIT